MLAFKLLASLAAAGAIAPGPALYKSSQLWATVDICNAQDKPNTLGIRGSMPGDERPHDAMFMRFRVQYLSVSGATHRWVDLPGADSGFLAVGTGAAARQGGRSFEFAPTPGKPAFTLRGVVSFQWRRGTHVEHTTNRATVAGHKSLAGADPAGFSAATCTLA